MAEHYLDERISRILTLEDHTMKLLCIAVGLAAALLAMPALLIDTCAQQANSGVSTQKTKSATRADVPATSAGEEPRAQGSKEHSGAITNRQLRRSGGMGRAIRLR